MLNLKKKLNISHLFCVILFIWNTLYVIEAFRIAPPIQKGQVSATFFPLIISFLMYITIALVFFTSYNQKNVTATSFGQMNKPALVVLVTIFYITLFKIIGYMASSILYIFAIISIFEIKKKNILIKLFYAVIIAVIIYILYEKIFLIRLPKLGGNM
ncbi:MAG: hypothetical protein XD76_1548 [candidate division TA06 bacterium 32_111]|nr:MAG: hypothetical protein XD76_1548 [candidate division TA06 bacterium 32_111]